MIVTVTSLESNARLWKYNHFDRPVKSQGKPNKVDASYVSDGILAAVRFSLCIFVMNKKKCSEEYDPYILGSEISTVTYEAQLPPVMLTPVSTELFVATL